MQLASASILEIRERLLSEHRGLREMASDVRDTLRQWAQHEATPEEVRRALLALASSIRAHNAYEEKALGSILRTAERGGSAIMNDEHLNEHAVLLTALTSSAAAADPSAWRHLVGKLLDRLLDHMAREEQIILSAELLRSRDMGIETGS